MHTNDNQIRDYDLVLDKEFGAIGTKEREQAEVEAYSYYSSQWLRELREEVGISQAELARRAKITPSYMSRLEHGEIEPSAGLFFRIISALGLEVFFHKPNSLISTPL